MHVYVFDGLICTDITITFGGKTKTLRNVAIDGVVIYGIWLKSACIFKDNDLKLECESDGGVTQWESATLAVLKSGVQVPSSPPDLIRKPLIIKGFQFY